MKFGAVPLYKIGAHSLASLGRIEENRNSIACLNRPVLTSRGHSAWHLNTLLVSHVCVFVCVCVDVFVDLWSFFFIYYLVGILAIVAKMVQDLAELPCLEKQQVEEEVKGEAQPPSVPLGVSVQPHPDFAFGGPQTAFVVPGNRQFSEFA